MSQEDITRYAPPFEPLEWDPREQWYVKPFFTNLSRSVYAGLIPSPEIFGALCSRTSRAPGDLRHIFCNEFVKPFVEPKRDEEEGDAEWRRRQTSAERLRELISFLHRYGWQAFLANPKARTFYSKWLAQYGDDSIAQMAGTHVMFTGLSQVAIKHFEDQRIGLAPIEKSTRYVDFSEKINGQYRYYVDPNLTELGLEEEYRRAMDGLFDTYVELLPKVQEWLVEQFPEESSRVIRAKAFDTLRGLLPVATVSQVAFFGNGQAFEYMVSRAREHQLGEIRWAAQRAYEELFEVTPSFLRRVTSEPSKDYQKYLAERKARVAGFVTEDAEELRAASPGKTDVELIEYDPEGELTIITGMLYDAHGSHRSWQELFARVKGMSEKERRNIVAKYFEGRTARWQKAGRALENSFVRFEIMMNIGAWRDLHRHRMHTQQRQQFSCYHGYDIPKELKDAGFTEPYKKAIEQAEQVFDKIAAHDTELAQYAVTLAHRVRFQQWQNLRAFFWEVELRTIPEGHPDYRVIEQDKFRLLKDKFPILSEYVHVNLGDYDFARRGQEERIAAKEKELKKQIKQGG